MVGKFFVEETVRQWLIFVSLCNGLPLFTLISTPVGTLMLYVNVHILYIKEMSH